ncbi:MAG TPA: HAMP domain-containing protein, partial [Candidatus Binataceae bacterium]|nr:HAMP domain-containing protein [Candidatus Binataceae bacterium]
MKPPSLQSRIRNGSLIVVLLIVAVGAYALPQIGRLGGAIRDTLQRNYISIDAAHHMHASLHRLQVAELKGDAHGELPSARDEFTHWMDIENHDFTEIGEPDLAHDIQKRATRLFGEIDSSPPGSYHDAEFDQLHQRLDALIAMNQAAMFRADSRAWQLSHRLAYNFAAGLGLIMVAGIFLSWTLGWALARPLRELSERLHGIGQRHTNLRIGPQRLAELDAVAREFNQMAEQLEHYEKLNVERLVYEKSKTEAIIESLEDGVVLIDSSGVITHINEIAAIILGLDPDEALG